MSLKFEICTAVAVLSAGVKLPKILIIFFFFLIEVFYLNTQ